MTFCLNLLALLTEMCLNQKCRNRPEIGPETRPEIIIACCGMQLRMLRICRSAAKQHDTVFEAWVLVVGVVASRQIPRSRTKMAGTTRSSPTRVGILVIWCCLRPVERQRTSVLAMLSCKQLLRIHKATIVVARRHQLLEHRYTIRANLLHSVYGLSLAKKYCKYR